MSAVSRKFIVMGVSGCGKSRIAGMLAEATGGRFLDADDFHSAENKAKMAAGTPLTDEDRWPWLDTLNEELRRTDQAEVPVFLACSALRQVYRDRLSAGLPALTFIYLQGSKELILGRMSARANHFMPTKLLDSQFATLEEPREALTVSIAATPSEIVAEVLQGLSGAA